MRGAILCSIRIKTLDRLIEIENETGRSKREVLSDAVRVYGFLLKTDYGSSLFFHKSLIIKESLITKRYKSPKSSCQGHCRLEKSDVALVEAIANETGRSRPSVLSNMLDVYDRLLNHGWSGDLLYLHGYLEQMLASGEL